jgi:predicted SnoaL-like aldol condensation-catalyzing enzyme
MRQTSLAAANKALVCDFYHMVFNAREPRRAFERYVAADYIQHNPSAAQGREAAIGFIEHILRQAPERKVRIVRAIAEDDLVVLHIHIQNRADEPGDAHADFFRVTNGVIVEHWDVAQPVPRSAAATDIMFCNGRPD